jgi:hypothetical protein
MSEAVGAPYWSYVKIVMGRDSNLTEVIALSDPEKLRVRRASCA